MPRERYDHQFAVFNLHVNKAGYRAGREFKAQYGQEKYAEHIEPLYEKGVMSVFQHEPNVYEFAWVALVTAFVNEKVKYRLPRAA